MYVFGSATLIAFPIQVVSGGIALATAYVSSADKAYESLQWITHQAFMGHLLGGIYYFGASAIVLLLEIHMIRTFLMGSYKFPRELNWVVCVLLLGLTLLMGFTGQLLRWDKNGVWSTVVAAEQAGRVPILGPYLATFLLGGQTVGRATLSRFFAWYFAVLALLPHGTEAYVIVGAPAIARNMSAGASADLQPRAACAVAPAVGGGERRAHYYGRRRVMGRRSTIAMVSRFRRKSASNNGGPRSRCRVGQGAVLFHDKDCEYCHAVGGIGGNRGPQLSSVADRMTQQQMTLRIPNGANNMP